MEPTGSPFRRPPARAPCPKRRGFGPVPAEPLGAVARRPAPAVRGRGVTRGRESPARARMLGAAGLYVVAGLALVGAVLALTGHEPGAVVGLGLTRFTDALAAGASNALALAALAHGAVVVGFAFLGALVQRGRLRPLVIGAAVYVLDALLVLAAHDWVAVAIHTVVLALMVRGLTAGRR